MYLVVDDFDARISVMDDDAELEELANSRRLTTIRWNVDTESFEELSDLGDWEPIKELYK